MNPDPKKTSSLLRAEIELESDFFSWAKRQPGFAALLSQSEAKRAAKQEKRKNDQPVVQRIKSAPAKHGRSNQISEKEAVRQKIFSLENRLKVLKQRLAALEK